MNRQQIPTAHDDHRFALGQIVATPGALQALADAGQTVAEFVERHVRGDWGDLSGPDKKLNDDAVAHEGEIDLRTRVLSAYTTAKGDRLWLITEADCASTCLLLPSEY